MGWKGRNLCTTGSLVNERTCDYIQSNFIISTKLQCVSFLFGLKMQQHKPSLQEKWHKTEGFLLWFILLSHMPKRFWNLIRVQALFGGNKQLQIIQPCVRVCWLLVYISNLPLILSWLLARKAVSMYGSAVLVGAPLHACSGRRIGCVLVGNLCLYQKISRDLNGGGQESQPSQFSSSTALPYRFLFCSFYLFFCCCFFFFFSFSKSLKQWGAWFFFSKEHKSFD